MNFHNNQASWKHLGNRVNQQNKSSISYLIYGLFFSIITAQDTWNFDFEAPSYGIVYIVNTLFYFLLQPHVIFK